MKRKRIIELKAVCKDNPPSPMRTACWEALIELEQLQIAVDKLPKDAEGVHCGPGDRRWAWTHVGRESKATILEGGVFWEPGGEPDWRIGFGLKAHPAAVGAGYSTREACRKHKKRQVAISDD